MKLKIYFYTAQYRVKNGSVSADDVMCWVTPPSGDEIPLGSAIVEIDLPGKDQIIQAQVNALEGKISQVRAEAEVEISKLQSRLDELRALEVLP